MLRYISVIALSVLTFLTVNIFTVQAQETLLPKADVSDDECFKILNEFEVSDGTMPTKDEADKAKEAIENKDKLSQDANDKLAALDKVKQEQKDLKTAVNESQTALKTAETGLNDAKGEYAKYDAACKAQKDPIQFATDCTGGSETKKAADKKLQDAQDKNDDSMVKYTKAVLDQSDPKKKKELDAKHKKALDDLTAANDKVTEADKAAKKAGIRENLLGCGIKTGRISLVMIPHYISYMANWLLGIVGILSVLFIVLGGYYYIYGGIVEDKEKGKKTIMHALMGMSLAILSWVIVTIIITAITG